MSILLENIKFFQQVNQDCLLTNEQPVPLTSENSDYYEHQMENLEFEQSEIDDFLNWIKTQN
jgi:hypothetical protein